MIDTEEEAEDVEDADEALRAAVEGERRLLDPEVRASSELASMLLDPEFFEFGVSGRRWDRVSILGAMAPDADRPDETPVVTDMSANLLASGLVHVTYMSEGNGRRARRSSLWRRTGEGWRLYFHQGTPTDDDE